MVHAYDLFAVLCMYKLKVSTGGRARRKLDGYIFPVDGKCLLYILYDKHPKV